MGFIQLVKLDKYSELFPTMTEFFKPVTKVDKTKTASQIEVCLIKKDHWMQARN